MLIPGARQILNDNEIVVVANTAEDLWVAGGEPFPVGDRARPKGCRPMCTVSKPPNIIGGLRLYGDIVPIWTSMTPTTEGLPHLDTRLMHERQAKSLTRDIMAVIRRTRSRDVADTATSRILEKCYAVGFDTLISQRSPFLSGGTETPASIPLQAPAPGTVIRPS